MKKNLNCPMNHILYQIFKIIWNIYYKSIGKKHFNKNLSIKTYINKIENGIPFKIKTGYYFELITPETMKLLERTKSKITKNKNGENVSHLKITELVLIHCNVVSNSYQQNSRVLHTFVPNKLFCQLWNILLENFTFSKTFDSEFSYIDL